MHQVSRNDYDSYLDTPEPTSFTLEQLSLTPTTSNPGSTSTLWIDSSDNHLHLGSTDLQEASSTGDVVGPSSSTAAHIPRFANNSGKLLDDSGIEMRVSGTNNLIMGKHLTGDFITTGSNNSAYGYLSGQSIASGNGNAILGATAGAQITGGSFNTIVGRAAGQNTTTGSNNFFAGYLAGSGCDIDATHNLMISAGGASGESATIRIGDQNNQDTCYIAGIYPTATTSLNSGYRGVFIDSNGRMGAKKLDMSHLYTFPLVTVGLGSAYWSSLKSFSTDSTFGHTVSKAMRITSISTTLIDKTGSGVFQSTLKHEGNNTNLSVTISGTDTSGYVVDNQDWAVGEQLQLYLANSAGGDSSVDAEVTMVYEFL